MLWEDVGRRTESSVRTMLWSRVMRQLYCCGKKH